MRNIAFVLSVILAAKYAALAVFRVWQGSGITQKVGRHIFVRAHEII